MPPQTFDVLFDALNERPIAYHRIYARVTGSVTAGLLLSQLLYWAKAVHYREYYKTDAELREETGLGTKELRNAKKKIADIITITVKGAPAKTYYKVEKDKILAKITSLTERDKLDEPKGTNQFDRKGETSSAERDKHITENTSETTTETTTDTCDADAPPDTLGATINSLIKEFQPVNPSFARFYPNKTQRAAIERLVKQHGEGAVRAIIQFLPKTNGKKYAPTITTPLQLEEKLAALKSYCDKLKDAATPNKPPKEIIGL